MKKKIVIVEDDLLIQELHNHYVTNLGHEVVACFTSGEEAVEFFKENNADLVLMDIRLEDQLDGIETMKQIEEFYRVPVIYLSANSEDSNYKRALQTNMKGFLSKPIAKDELEKLIDDLKDVNDSILYAERIQRAIFPQPEEIDKVFATNIFLNRPRNIISGDFCFIENNNSNEIIAGIGDCTGHGIPAALLSVLSFQLVTSISKNTHILRDIINNLNKSLIKNLSRTNSKNKVNDSLDIIIFKVSSKNSEIEVSGIKREFIHFDSKTKKHHLHRLKSKSLGTPFESIDEIPFLKIKYEKDDMFYFFSDGVTDQFGGEHNKKLLRSRLIQFLDDNAANTDYKKKQVELNVFLRKWQGINEQTDDMIMLGINPSSLIQTKVAPTKYNLEAIHNFKYNL